MNNARYGWLMSLGLAGLTLTGCVERTVKIDTRPQGALVIVNDQEVGVSPVKFSFLWYGDYDLVIRRNGYETVKTHFRIDAPWYQLPPFDLVAETMIVGTIHDDHVLPPIELTPAEEPDVNTLVERAAAMRRDASGGAALD